VSHEWADEAMSVVEDESSGLLHVLSRLVTALAPPLPGDPILDESQRATVPERWEDDDYVYVEARLPGAAGSEIDINIHRGLVLIRIAR